MRIIFVIYCAFFLFSQCIGQSWIRTYGENLYAVARYVAEDYDKGFIILSDIKHYKYSWILKTDINGFEKRNLKIGNGVYECTSCNIEKTTDGGCIIGGGTISKYDASKDAYILKLNRCAELSWCKVLNYPNTYELGNFIKPTDDGGYVYLVMCFGGLPENILNLFKFDSVGELVWHKVYNNDSLTFGEEARSLSVDDSTVLITGNCYYPNPGGTGGYHRSYFIQTDNAGNENWSLVFGKNEYLYGKAMVSIPGLSVSNYYSIGARWGTPYGDCNTLFKFDRNGNEQGYYSYFPDSEGGMGTSINWVDSAKLVLGLGWAIAGLQHYGLCKSDTIGNISILKELPDPDNSGISWTMNTSDNKLLSLTTNYYNSSFRLRAFKFNYNLEYDSIYTMPLTYDSLCDHQILSDTIDPNCDFVVGIEEPWKKPETVQFKVYPNPASTKLAVESPKYISIENQTNGFVVKTIFHKWQSAVLEVYNLFGNRVLVKEVFQGEVPITLDVSGWERGLYFFRLKYNNQTLPSVKILIK